MRASRKTFRSRRRGETAMEFLAAHLVIPDEAAWYAARLERLGQVMFGDLWNNDVPQPTSKPETKTEPKTKS
jgi:hypothetical protein